MNLQFTQSSIYQHTYILTYYYTLLVFIPGVQQPCITLDVYTREIKYLQHLQCSVRCKPIFFTNLFLAWYEPTYQQFSHHRYSYLDKYLIGGWNTLNHNKNRQEYITNILDSIPYTRRYKNYDLVIYGTKDSGLFISHVFALSSTKNPSHITFLDNYVLLIVYRGNCVALYDPVPFSFARLIYVRSMICGVYLHNSNYNTKNYNHFYIILFLIIYFTGRKKYEGVNKRRKQYTNTIRILPYSPRPNSYKRFNKIYKEKTYYKIYSSS